MNNDEYYVVVDRSGKEVEKHPATSEDLFDQLLRKYPLPDYLVATVTIDN